MLLNRLFSNSKEISALISLNNFIHNKNETYKYYHRAHIEYTAQYARILNTRLDFKLNINKLMYAAYAHDLLKEKGLTNTDREWKGFHIPTSTVQYVRLNLDILEKFNMDDYFNSSAQYHALAAGIFLNKEFGIEDPEIIYPVMFHSCPIISVYETLPRRVQNSIDIIMLADKLSSNYLRINWRKCEVKVDLGSAVFGMNENEIHYTLGLYLSRLISDEKPTEEQSKIANEYYLQRLKNTMPFIKKIDLGGNKIWPERKSLLLTTL